MNILFVCTGNTCRSPMAEAIAKGIIGSNPELFGHIKVASAGTMGVLGVKASENAVRVANEKGLELGNFTSQPLSKELIDEADLILVMTYNHKNQVLQLSAEAQNKVFLLKEYSKGVFVDEIIPKIAVSHTRLYEARNQFIAENKEKFEQLEAIRLEMGETSIKYKEYLMDLEKEMQDYTTKQQKEIIELQRVLSELEVIDPYGGNLAIYQACHQELEEEIKFIFTQLTTKE